MVFKLKGGRKQKSASKFQTPSYRKGSFISKRIFDHKTATFRFIPTIDNSVLPDILDHFERCFVGFGQEYQKGDHQEKYQ